ncbi:MAG TPA: hypothetical protein VIJ47_08305 [Acidimicrobiales bacterium]
MATPAITVLNTITETQEKVLETVLNIEGPVVDYVRKAADYVEPNLPEFPTKDLTEDVPTLRQFVDNQFAFAAKVLDTQHKFVLELLDATKPVAEKVAVQKPAVGVKKVTKATPRKRVAAAA